MPNWCNNTVKITGSKDNIREFENFLEQNNGKDWFDFFEPCPEELKNVGDVSASDSPNEKLIEKYGYADWYSFGIGQWGCKWNCDAQDWQVEDGDEGQSTISFWFDSPWGPPEQLYQSIFEEKFGPYSVYAEWHEEGMAFVGRFEDGFSDNYEYSELESLDEIPEDLVENWNLRERFDENEEWNDDCDEELENGK